MDKIKNYRVITNRKYRLCCNVFIPVVLCVIGLLAILNVSGQIGLLVIASLWISMESMGDYFCFAGVLRTGGMGMDYLKTSIKGRKMIKDTFWMDLLVRPTRIIFFMMITGIPLYTDRNMIWIVLGCALCIVIGSVWAPLISRHMDSLALISMFMIVVEIIVLAGCICVFVAIDQNFTVLCLGIEVLLAVAGIVACGKCMVSKLEESYYDDPAAERVL